MNGISKTLNQVFGDGYEIYKSKDVQQGLSEPCFFIAHVGSSRKRRIGNRYQSFNSFDVQYFPKEKGGNAEMISVAEQLYTALEFVQLLNGDLIRGTSMRDESHDGVLHFFVDFNMFLNRETEFDPMEAVVSSVSIKKE